MFVFVATRSGPHRAHVSIEHFEERGIIDLIINPSDEENINISILEKIKLIDSLDEEEKEALFKIIDMAIAKKKLKDNLTNLMKE